LTINKFVDVLGRGVQESGSSSLIPIRDFQSSVNQFLAGVGEKKVHIKIFNRFGQLVTGAGGAQFKIIAINQIVIGENYRARQNALQLADVARPRVGAKLSKCSRRKSAVPKVRSIQPLQRKDSYADNFRAALTQRWNGQGDGV
jgi:hypothetical protein